uniref:ShKT domain-containing protein n=1 Tax=Attheya septentrionalis TaxID=420275 RepID=A0A7S2U6I8_9STRA|mmetsp:Transcript_10926/g.19945  ORF Transcript_10926/g.19945 Transcript_10926/m.19945 type:complete len:254 (+) Transcript_10926:476-1237(+)
MILWVVRENDDVLETSEVVYQYYNDLDENEEEYGRIVEEEGDWWFDTRVPRCVKDDPGNPGTTTDSMSDNASADDTLEKETLEEEEEEESLVASWSNNNNNNETTAAEEITSTMRITTINGSDGVLEQEQCSMVWIRIHMGIAQEIPNTPRTNNNESQAFSQLLGTNDTNHDDDDGVVLLLQMMARYLREEVLMDDGYAHVMDRCINQNASCVEWASQVADECRTNHEYMTAHCRLACQRCHDDSKYMSLFLK